MSDAPAARPCTVCRHKKCAAIEADLAAGVPEITIAQRYGVTKVALRNHLAHKEGSDDEALNTGGAAEHRGAAVIQLRPPSKPCPICSHPKRPQIELAIASGDVWSKIGRHFLVDAAAVKEHATTCAPQLRAKPTSEKTAKERCLDMVKRAEDLIDEVSDDLDASYGDKAKVLTAAKGLIDSLGRFTGELTNVTEVVIVDSPRWKRIEAKLIEALSPFGSEVLEAAGKALQELDAA